VFGFGGSLDSSPGDVLCSGGTVIGGGGEDEDGVEGEEW
jgi:hypothetical protein